jgi:opacity protein-like surface antigen
MKKLLAGTVFAALVGGIASAADMPVAPPAYRPPDPVVAHFTWTGCYGGANAGALLVRNNTSMGLRPIPVHPPSAHRSAAMMPAGGSLACS